MKRIALFALTLIMLLTVTLLPLAVSAEGESDASAEPTTAGTTRALDPNKLNISVGTATAKQGDLVEVPVIIETNPGVWGMNLDVHYEETVMVLRKVTFSDEFKKDMTCLDIDNQDDTKDSNYNIPFGLYAEGQSLTGNVKTTGLFATLTFLVIPGAELGDTVINITYKPNNVIDVDGNNVKTAIPQDVGKVTVTEGKPAEPGVTYFPSRTRKAIADSANKSASKGLPTWGLILIVLGVVLVVGVVIAILIVSKPANNGGEAEKAAPARVVKTPDDADTSSPDDGIDDQA